MWKEKESTASSSKRLESPPRRPQALAAYPAHDVKVENQKTAALAMAGVTGAYELSVNK